MAEFKADKTAFAGGDSRDIREVEVGIGGLSIAEVVAVARHGARVTVAPDAREEVAATRQRVEDLAAAETPVSGVSTGFGALARRHIPAEKRARLQLSLVRSHAAGSGPEVEEEVIRALMLLCLSTLCTGRTGVRPVVVDTYAAALNAGIVPVVYEYGSLGCSGDLAPLAHCALALLGEGEVRVEGKWQPAAEALEGAGIQPLQLREKEGLALINGTEGMLGQLCLAIADLETLARQADTATALTLEGLQGAIARPGCLLGALRPAGGRRLPGHAGARPRGGCQRAGRGGGQPGRGPGRPGGLQRQFSRRARGLCARPSGDRGRGSRLYLGAAHGPLLDVARNRSLPAFVADDPGVNSGHMIAQYTQAGIVSELKRLAAPASADSIPSSAMQEDHVSMGWSAARKLRRSIDGAQRVVAIEILTAARGIDLRGTTPGAGVAAVVAALRERVPGVGPDRYLAPEIAAAVQMVQDGTFLRAAESAVGQLQ